MSDDNFYEELSVFKNFSAVTSDEHYRRIPGDWFLFVTDVKNSTEAIEAGNYRDVNKIGAASITTVKQEIGEVEFPFVFGGDGATLVLPPDQRELATDRLLRLKNLARDNFNLDLRVGKMTVSDVLQPEVSLEVAKLELTPGRDIAIFRGGGLTMADDLVKRERERFEVEGETDESIALTGLSCRWQPIPSQRGQVLSILIQARISPPGETYDEVLETLDQIINGGLNQTNPVDRSHMSYKSVRECFVDEVRYQDSLCSLEFIGRVFEILLAVAVFKFGFNPVFFDPDKYGNEMRTHSDYHKFDDMLRLIIDCDADETREIKNYLKERRSNQTIFYGIQEAEESLMTCYVEELDHGGHLHFVDGGDGGYAKAAKQLKSQVRTAAQNTS